GTTVWCLPTAESIKEYTQGLGFELAVAMVYSKTKQKLKTAVWTKINLDTVIKDPGSNVNAGEHCYTVPAEGYYHVEGNTLIDTKEATYAVNCRVYVNGGEVLAGSYIERLGAD